MQDGERKLPIHLRIKRSKVKITTELCQHFCSITITWIVFNIRLSYFIDAGWWEEDPYIFWGPKVKVTTDLFQHFGYGTITGVVFIVQLSYFIHKYRMTSFLHTSFLFHTWMQDGERKILIHFWVQRSRSQLNFVNYLVLTPYLE